MREPPAAPHYRVSGLVPCHLLDKARTHLSLGKDAPVSRSIEEFGRIVAERMVGGLHHRYDRV